MVVLLFLDFKTFEKPVALVGFIAQMAGSQFAIDNRTTTSVKANGYCV